MTFESAVDALVSQGWDRATAEREVQRQYPNLARAFPVTPARDERVLEKAEQWEIRKIAMAYGFKVLPLSQPRATKQAPGFPDLWLFHRHLPIAFWWETKRQVGGALEPAQEDFRDDCIRTRTGHGYGDRYAFVEKLLELELAVRGAGAYGIEPVRHLSAETNPEAMSEVDASIANVPALARGTLRNAAVLRAWHEAGEPVPPPARAS